MYNQTSSITNDEGTTKVYVQEQDGGVLIGKVFIPTDEEQKALDLTFYPHDLAVLLMSMLSNVYNGDGQIVEAIEGEPTIDYIEIVVDEDAATSSG